MPETQIMTNTTVSWTQNKHKAGHGTSCAAVHIVDKNHWATTHISCPDISLSFHVIQHQWQKNKTESRWPVMITQVSDDTRKGLFLHRCLTLTWQCPEMLIDCKNLQTTCSSFSPGPSQPTEDSLEIRTWHLLFLSLTTKTSKIHQQPSQSQSEDIDKEETQREPQEPPCCLLKLLHNHLKVHYNLLKNLFHHHLKLTNNP